MDEQQAEHAEQHATRASDPDIYLRQMCRMLESQQEAAQVMGANKVLSRRVFSLLCRSSLLCHTDANYIMHVMIGSIHLLLRICAAVFSCCV